VSSLARSGERRDLEVQSLVVALSEQIARMRDRGEWQKLSCLELLMVRGWANRDVAAKLNISEQAVANFKFDFTSRLRNVIRKQALSADVFPELYAEE
jgi:RNA polymerase sigma-70 factor (ECF subfamily)